ncbi:hypothetical protein DFH27DRAFT_180162 [Peziza echinospora]|nr:hypothetical protein DFH27DRAFT_180162 [Peziza echinospora]
MIRPRYLLVLVTSYLSTRTTSIEVFQIENDGKFNVRVEIRILQPQTTLIFPQFATRILYPFSIEPRSRTLAMARSGLLFNLELMPQLCSTLHALLSTACFEALGSLEDALHPYLALR